MAHLVGEDRCQTRLLGILLFMCAGWSAELCRCALIGRKPLAAAASGSCDRQTLSGGGRMGVWCVVDLPGLGGLGENIPDEFLVETS